MKPSRRIEFASADPAQFNALRDRWRVVANGCTLPKVAYKIASLLPSYVNREYGYAFPTDHQLAEIIKSTPRNVGRGMNALDAAGLIERQTKVKRDEKGEAIGRLRRIFLALPIAAPEVNGQPHEVNGPKHACERTTIVRIYSNRTTLDKVRKCRERKVVAAYVPAREGAPPVIGNDHEFLNAFDRIVLELMDGRTIGAGEIEQVTKLAFDRATDSSDLFMPIHWIEICALNSSETSDWFRRRAGQLFHRRAA